MRLSLKALKRTSFALQGIIVLILAVATIAEKMHGTDYAISNIYTAWWMVALWTLSATTALFYTIATKLYKHIAVFALHASLVLILIGAFVTHTTSRHGHITLKESVATETFTLGDGSHTTLPFTVELTHFEQVNHRGSTAPMDYVTEFNIAENDEVTKGRVSMNKIWRHKGYRFYMSRVTEDGVELAVAYDAWGIGITYTAYALLLLSIIAFFISRATHFRELLSHPALKRGSLVVAFAFIALSASANTSSPRTISVEAAEAFGRIAVYHNDRVCPMQTFAREFTTKLYGKPTYKDLSAEQVVAGWYFYYDDWADEPMIKVKGEVKSIIGIDGNYATLKDFQTPTMGNKLTDALTAEDRKLRQDAADTNDKLDLIFRLANGELFRIFPIADASGEIGWYAPGEVPLATVEYDEWLFINQSLNIVGESVARRDHKRVEEIFSKIATYQRNKADSVMPTEEQFEAEITYNSTNYNRPLAMASIAIGVICFVVLMVAAGGWRRYLRWGVMAWLMVLFVYLSYRIGMRWYITEHVPLSNGYETMQFMAWGTLIVAFIISRKVQLAPAFGALISGAAMMVAMMGESSPRITQLVPVLHSPLLSIHVVVIMLAYVLLAFIMLNGIAALLRRKNSELVEYHTVVSRIMLYPAVFLLAIGIFIGAVWANVSWGRYWGWDPKEVWALITMLIYALPLHYRSISLFRRPTLFHIYMIIAFLSVLVTYFGVNFFLGGMHSYA